MTEPAYFGGIELGGTKIVLAVGRGDGEIVRRATIPTRAPDLVLPEIAEFFEGCGVAVSALGAGAFGPVVIDRAAASYGRVLETNKPGWSGFDLVGALKAALGLPVALVTDVGAAAIGEAKLGALRGMPLGVYLTVGTGIGGAIVSGGALLPALLHPEFGHIALQRHREDHAASTCRFHDQCAEGLAAGPAVSARFGQSLSHFAPGSFQHLLIADYLGQLCANLVLFLSPHRIVLGGGVAQTEDLLPAVNEAMLRHLGGYASSMLDAQSFIVPPQLGGSAGVIGAVICAATA